MTTLGQVGAVRKRGGTWSTLLAGLAGGIIAWTVIDPYYPFYTLPNEQRQPTDEEVFLAYYGNAGWVFAAFGAAVTGLIGLAARLDHRRLATLLLVLAGGVPLGAALGAAGGFFGQYCGFLLSNVGSDYRIARTTIMHAAAWSGTALGVAIVVGAGTWRRFGGAVGRAWAAGVLAAMLYCPLVAIFLPMQDTDSLIPNARIPRMFWILLAAGLLGLLVGTTARPRHDADSTSG